MEQTTPIAPIAPAAIDTTKLMIRIEAIAGATEAKETATLWLGRQVGKAARKDLQLSAAIPQITAEQVAALDFVKVATIINDEWIAYIRRVKCQRLEIGSAIELPFELAATDYANQVINMLSAPATRAKKLVSTASIRALFLADIYKEAAKAVMGDKLDAWKRIGERELIPLVCATDAGISSTRTKARDTAVLRMMEIAARMQEGNEHRTVLEAAAELLAELPTVDLDDSI